MGKAVFGAALSLEQNYAPMSKQNSFLHYPGIKFPKDDRSRPVS